MKRLLIAAAFALAAATTTALAAPAAPAQPATPAAKAAPGMPAECLERLRAHAEHMKKELGLSDAQSAAMRNELERYHGQLMVARADHRSAVAKILDAEQNAKLDAHHQGRREKLMERCGGMDDDAPRGKHKA